MTTDKPLLREIAALPNGPPKKFLIIKHYGADLRQATNMSMRKYLKEVGVTSQQAIEQVVREERLAGKGKLKVKMVLTGEGIGLNHVVEGEIDLSDAH